MALDEIVLITKRGRYVNGVVSAHRKPYTTAKFRGVQHLGAIIIFSTTMVIFGILRR